MRSLAVVRHEPKVASVNEPASASETAVAKPTYILSSGVANEPALFLKIKLSILFSRCLLRYLLPFVTPKSLAYRVNPYDTHLNFL